MTIKEIKNFAVLINNKQLENISYEEIIGEFWTSKQRQGHSLHEISYRACFKSELPNYFIKRFTQENDLVYDPFMGRGTTILESNLMGRIGIGNDINPLSKILLEPRLSPPCFTDIRLRLNEIKFRYDKKADIDLSMFYHSKTESEIVSLKDYFIEKESNNELDFFDKWIRMVATNRLTGHSKGFFSVYTLPPNQAVSPQRQREINKKRNQTPEYKNIKEIILKKTQDLLKKTTLFDFKNLREKYFKSILLNNDARFTSCIQNESIKLIVTSPPFLSIVQYAKDNWLRCWFNGINIDKIEKEIFVTSSLEKWKKFMYEVFIELYRVLRNDGIIAFEVGEVKNGTIKLEEELIPIVIEIGFNIECILINEQNFTKTSNIWGIKNNKKGTNSNRILILTKGEKNV